MRSVLRLIDSSVRRRSERDHPPGLSPLRRVIRLHRPIDGKWLCRNCIAKSRAQPCCALRGRPRGRHPRRARATAVSPTA